jgi:hypothetical protein
MSDYAALLIHSRTCVRYAGLVGTWHDPDVGRPIAAPLERCAELLGVDLAAMRSAAANVEPYLRADGARIWSRTQLERQLGLTPLAGAAAVTWTAADPGRRCLAVIANRRWLADHAHRSTRTTSNCLAVGGMPVSNFALTTARRRPKRAAVVGTSNSGLVITASTTPEERSGRSRILLT